MQTLIDLGILSREALKSHCENHKKPSPFIFFLENSRWLLENLPLAKKPTLTDDRRCVAFLNVKKLRRMSVILQRSDLIAEQAKIPVFSEGQQNGVRFTSVYHWLVYDWIPAQCIERVTSFKEYEELYAAHGMKGSSRSWLRENTSS